MLDDYYFDKTVMLFAHFQLNGWSETSGLFSNKSLVLSDSTTEQMVQVDRVYAPEKIYEGCVFRAELTPIAPQSHYEMTIKPECDIPEITLTFSTRPEDQFDAGHYLSYVRLGFHMAMLSLFSIHQTMQQYRKIVMSQTNPNHIAILTWIQLQAWNYSMFVFAFFLALQQDNGVILYVPTFFLLVQCLVSKNLLEYFIQV